MRSGLNTFDLDAQCHALCSAQLALRRDSCALASTSQTSRTSARAYYSNFSYQGNGLDSRAKTICIPWDESIAAAHQYWEEAETPVKVADSQASQKDTKGKSDERASTRREPLKINRDLLLYRAKSLRRDVFKITDFTRKSEMIQEVETTLRRCIALDPTDARAYVSLGKHLRLERRFEEAGRVYDDGIAVTGGQNAHLWQSWATLEAKLGNVAQARKYFKAAVLVSPDHAAAWHAWGMLEKQEGNYIKARDIWIKGVKKCGKSPNPHLYNSLAVLAGEMGFVEEAREWFKKGTASVRGAQSHALWHAWALLEERSGEPRAVRYLFRKGLQASPGSRYIHLAWAMFEKAEGSPDNARQLLRRGNELNRNDGAILQAWAILEEESGCVDRARELFQAAAKANPRMVHIWQAWGMLEQRQGDFREARRLFQSAVWSSTANADACKVWQAWAVLEYKAGNIALARSMHGCAVKADPDSGTAWESWIRMEEDLEQYKRANWLVAAREAGRDGSDIPLTFLSPAEITMEKSEPNLLESVVSTVSTWIKKFESKRQVVQRRPPSYLNPPITEEFFEEQQCEQLDIKDMIEFDQQEFNLAKMPRKRPQIPKEADRISSNT